MAPVPATGAAIQNHHARQMWKVDDYDTAIEFFVDALGSTWWRIHWR